MAVLAFDFFDTPINLWRRACVSVMACLLSGAAQADVPPGSTFDSIFPDPVLAGAVARQLNKSEASQPVTQAELDTITNLSVSGGGIKSLSGIGYLTQLEHLKAGVFVTGLGTFISSVHFNYIDTLPAEIANLSRLKTLDLEGNLLASWPEPLNRLSSLQALSLRYNPLSELPESIGNLQQLNSLDLSMIRLPRLPDAIGSLQQLQTLHIYGNKLAALPGTMSQLKNLTYLDASFNALVEALPPLPASLSRPGALFDVHWQTASLPPLYRAPTGPITFADVAPPIVQQLMAETGDLGQVLWTITYDYVKPDGSPATASQAFSAGTLASINASLNAHAFNQGNNTLTMEFPGGGPGRLNVSVYTRPIVIGDYSITKASIGGGYGAQTVTATFVPDAADFGQAGAVFVFAQFPADHAWAPNTIWFFDAGRNWHFFTDCSTAPAYYAGKLEVITPIPVVAMPSDLRELAGTKLYIGSSRLVAGAGSNPIGDACTDMVARGHIVGVAELQ